MHCESGREGISCNGMGLLIADLAINGLVKLETGLDDAPDLKQSSFEVECQPC